MFKKIGKDEIVKGSLILFIMINIFNFLNYVFHFSMARLLSAENYGVLAVLMSLVYIFGVPAEGIQTIVSRYTSKFNIRNEQGKIKFLLIKAIKKIIVLSLILFLVYIPVSFLLSYFTKINANLIIFTGVLLFGILLVPITRGIMQGKKKFKQLGFNMIFESILKLAMSIIFVYLGFKVYGAMGGVILGVIFVLFISFFQLKKIIDVKIEETKIEDVYAYSFPVFLVMLTIMMIASLDIIFVKSFFSSEIAGKYAVASMLGKMIFFGTFGIGKAMFPLTSEQHDRGRKPKELFKKSFFMMLVVCFLSVLAFLLVPKLIITVLFSSKYIEIANILVFVGLAYSFLSLSNLLLLYALSTHRKKVSFFAVFIFLEILFFLIFHKSLLQFSIFFAIINIIMFIALLLFTIKDKK